MVARFAHESDRNGEDEVVLDVYAELCNDSSVVFCLHVPHEVASHAFAGNTAKQNVLQDIRGGATSSAG